MENFDIVNFATWFVAFLFSTTCHEAAHALAGRLGGDDTASDQVTLNPLPHMRREPFGMLVLPLLSGFMSGGSSLMGWASAPFDPYWAQRHPRRAALMSAAGPLANFLLAAVAIVALRSGFIHSAAVAQVVFVVALLNVLLGCFNLLPVPPLDGAGVLEGLGGSLARMIGTARQSPMASFLAFGVAIVFFRFAGQPLARLVFRLATGS